MPRLGAALRAGRCTRPPSGRRSPRSSLVAGRARAAAEPALPAEGSALHVPDYLIPLFGKFLCFAIVALAMDLIWGYTGILSLGHGVFFALGGYAMGMYLMRAIGKEGVYASELPDFMVFLDWKELPVVLVRRSTHFAFAALMALLVPGLARVRVRLLRVPLADPRRLLLDHHAGADLRVDAAVLPQRHRLRRQQRPHRLQAHPRLSRSQEPGTKSALYVASALALLLALPGLPLRRDVEGRPRAARDPRRRGPGALLGLQPARTTSSSSWTLSAVLCGLAGALYVPQVGIINPSELDARELDRDGDLGRRRRARHAGRRGGRRARW